jgi:hypothetical protein
VVLPDSGFVVQNTWSVGGLDSIQAFVELMIFSNLIINMSSTIVLDAICFDTPVIRTKFNFDHDQNSWTAAHNNFLADHYKPSVQSNAVYFPKSSKELDSAIQEALENPAERSKAGEVIPELPTSALIREKIVQVCEGIRRN